MSIQNETKIVPWIPIIELAVLAFTTLGTTITLYMFSETRTENFRSEVIGMHKEILAEMKDFHGRLCAIEERSKK